MLEMREKSPRGTRKTEERQEKPKDTSDWGCKALTNPPIRSSQWMVVSWHSGWEAVMPESLRHFRYHNIYLANYRINIPVNSKIYTKLLKQVTNDSIDPHQPLYIYSCLLEKMSRNTPSSQVRIAFFSISLLQLAYSMTINGSLWLCYLGFCYYTGDDKFIACKCLSHKKLTECYSHSFVLNKYCSSVS